MQVECSCVVTGCGTARRGDAEIILCASKIHESFQGTLCVLANAFSCMYRFRVLGMTFASSVNVGAGWRLALEATDETL
jgi:hypothetical protein